MSKVNSALVLELENRIAEHGAKLTTSSSGEALTQRARKRVMQKIGKLKKDLAAAKEGKLVQIAPDTDVGDKRAADSASDDEDKAPQQPASKKAKLTENQSKASSATTKETAPKQQANSLASTTISKTNKPDSKEETTKKVSAKQEKKSTKKVETTEQTSDAEDNVETEGKPVVVSKKEMKKQLHMLNQALADCAVKKQLSRAKKAFRQAEKKGIVMDVLTYTNLLNVYVRCNDMVGTREILDEMKEKCLDANTITLTTALKGYCELGMMSDASKLFLDYMIPKNKWNIRSLNTFLRGCTRIGGVDIALKAFQTCESQQELPIFDETEGQDAATCYEAIIALLCRANRVEEATKLVLSYVEKNDVINQEVKSHQHRSTKVLENAGLYTMLAKTMTLLGLFSDAKKYLKLASTLIQEGDQANLRDAMLKKFQEVAPTVGQGSAAADTTSKSVELFLAHKRSELRQILELLEEYMSVIQTVAIQPPKTLSANVVRQLTSEDYVVIEACRVYALALSQMLFFGFDGQSDLQQHLAIANDARPAEKLNAALEEKFGLQYLQPNHISPHLASVINGSNQRNNEDIQAMIMSRVKTMQEACKQRIERVINVDGRIDLQALFPDCVFAKKVKKEEVQKVVPKSSNKGKGGKFGKNEKSTNDPKGSSSSLYDGTLPKEYLKLLKAQSKANNEDSDEEESSDEEEEEQEEEKANEDEDGEDGGKSNIPIKLEIGSGNGDWIVAQAAADRVITGHNHSSSDGSPSNTITVRGNWIACELRCDRAHHIWSHHFLSTKHLVSSIHSVDQDASTVMRGGNNLAVLGGDASKIVKERIPVESISSIFINYPQPPERVAGDHKNQGKHLLTMEFFLDMMTILKKKGSITILTDNLSYAQSLALTVATINKMKLARRNDATHELLYSVEMEESEMERRVLQETVPFIEIEGSNDKKKKSSNIDFKRNVVIWRGDPGDDAGHIALVSSYFDRMWSLGHKKRRWFIFLRKKTIDNPHKQQQQQQQK